MVEQERRRSARRLVGQTAELHLGPNTVEATVLDVSQHGMGLALPEGARAEVGQTVWIICRAVASFAITATVRRAPAGRIGVEFDEILEGEALQKIESLPLSD